MPVICCHSNLRGLLLLDNSENLYLNGIESNCTELQALQPDGSPVSVVSSTESITKRMSGVVSWRGISWWECVCVSVCVLTGVELTVLSQFLRLFVEFIRGVEALVAVKVDTGGEVQHQHREGGDLLHDVLVFL